MDERIAGIFLTAVLATGIAAQWLAWRLRLPSILLLLAFGFALGQIAQRWMPEPTPAESAEPAEDGSADLLLAVPSAADRLVGRSLLFALVSLSVAVILFEGGLNLRLRELDEAGDSVVRLVTVGAVITWGLAGAAAWLLLGYSRSIAALLGAILTVTGPTVIAPLLRHVRPSRRLGSVVKWEGIVIDPIGAVLAVLVYEAVISGRGASVAAMLLTKTLLVGSLLGGLAALLLILLLARYWVPDFLHNAVVLAMVVVAFTASNYAQSESGLLAVTVMGMVLANQRKVSIHHVIEFKENLRTLLISTLFIVLASRVHWSDITNLGWRGGAFLAALIVVVRPVSVLVATLGTQLKMTERIFLALLAPRGIVAAAVSSIFALHIADLARHGRLSMEVLPQARGLASMTLLVVFGTVAFYGLLAAPLARWLKLAVRNPQGILFGGAHPWVQAIAAALQQEGFQVLLVDTNHRNIAAARMAGLPTYCASILADEVEEEIELGGFGRMLAVTPNDEVNALAAREFTELFGRAGVYQLTPWDSGTGKRQSLAEHLRGRLLFEPKTTFDEMARRHAAGWVVKRTPLTEQFSYADFLAQYPAAALPLFTIDSAGNLSVCTAESKPSPKAGHTLVALVDPTKQREEAEEDQPADEVAEKNGQ